MLAKICSPPQIEDHIGIDCTFAYLPDDAAKLIARTGFHGNGLHQLVELAKVVHLGLHLPHQLLVAGFQQAIETHQRATVLGQTTAAAVLAAGGADQQRFVGEIVHRIDRVPRRLVAQADVFRGMRDRTHALDAFQQRNATGADEFLALAFQPQTTVHGDRC